MFKIQNKSVLFLVFSVLVIDILIIRICFEFRYSNFGFHRSSQMGETYELMKYLILPL